MARPIIEKGDIGINILSVIPVRAEAAEQSEIVTQLLFGETMIVHEHKSPWVKMHCTHDGYEGWIDEKHFHHFDKENTVDTSTSSLITQRVLTTKGGVNVLLGSSISEEIKKQLHISFCAVNINPDFKATVMAFLNTPYLWGGRSTMGIDCSGFSQVAYKIMGTPLPRDASQQINEGIEVPISESILGDLAFFIKPNGSIHHVGIMLSPTEIIHASGNVRIDKIDNKGIFREDWQEYTHKLHTIKRIKLSS